ncbi:MAG: polyribonucleotide nucleotidyltransferase [Bacteroidales bacterium]|nr:polyribonucleotide nucleotidyltransferase [Bacteroidales bacterium]
MINEIKKSITLQDGRVIEISTGKLAKQADGSVVVKMGNTMLLATVVSAKEAREDVDFMPLSVEYREKYSAVGRFPGGFLKREGRLSDYEILVSRLIDRALRPLFPEDYHAETFVNVHLVSAGKDDMPDALAGLAASAALAVSDIPFHGPISEVRVSRINGKFVINPSAADNKNADIDIMVAATFDNIMMVEGEMNEVSETEMLDAIKFAHEAIKQQCNLQLELATEVGSNQKREYCHENNDEELKQKVWNETYDKALNVARKQLADKHERSRLFSEIEEQFLEQYDEETKEEIESLVKRYYHDVQKEAVRRMMLDENKRLDGRKMDEIRPIWCEVDYLPAAHGSAIFTRGETQALASVTFGNKLDEQMIDGATINGYEPFILHYNFPPFSTGDARPVRGVSRREVGHGNLAFRALKGMIPQKGMDFPYTVRLVSDILESNGSSSMATVCSGTLALMDAGVKMQRPVSGIAMGLITDKNSDKYVVLSDILGDEDHLGDMDFKITGTENGITATQMDIKVDGLSYTVMEEALEQAKQGRMHILKKMLEVLPEPRSDYKPHAPRLETITIRKDMIGAIIGPGGKIIQGIQADTNTHISIEEIDDLGYVEVSADNNDDLQAALNRIKTIVRVPEVGEVYKGTVKSITTFGAFVEIMPNQEGLLHISEIEWRRLRTVDEVLKEGQEVEVKVLEIDNKTGKIRLSRKVLLPRPPRDENKNNRDDNSKEK